MQSLQVLFSCEVLNWPLLYGRGMQPRKVSRILIFGARLEAPKAKKEGQRIKGEKVALVGHSTKLSMSYPSFHAHEDGSLH